MTKPSSLLPESTVVMSNKTGRLKKNFLVFSEYINFINARSDFFLPIVCFSRTSFILETVQDFLIKLDIKPLMHLLEISIFSLNNDLVRLTKIMNNLVKDLKILSFKVIFQCLKLVIFPKKNFCEEYLIRRPTYINEIFWKKDF